MKINNNKGAGLILVMLVMVILTILGTALLSLSSASAKLIAYQNKTKQAYYLAKSGADAVTTHLLNNPKDDTLLVTKISADNDSHFANGEFNVQVDNGASYQLNITGNGNVNGIGKSTTAVIRRLTVGELLNKAIYTKSPLDITGMVVEGDIQSGGDINYKTNGHNKYDTTTYKPLANSPVEMDTVTPEDDPDLYDGTGYLHVDGADKTVDESYKFYEIIIDQNKTLNIVANNKVVDIVVDTITAKGNININATGNGRVNLFVNTELEVQTKGFINNTHPQYLYIYMQEGSTFDLQAGIEVKAYVIAPDADAIIQSEKSTIFGALIANKLTKNGTNGPNGSVVFVPQENTSEVDDNLKAYKIVRWEE